MEPIFSTPVFHRLLYTTPVFEIFIIVQVSLIAGNSIEIAHINGISTLFIGQKSLVNLLPVADTNHVDLTF